MKKQDIKRQKREAKKLEDLDQNDGNSEDEGKVKLEDEMVKQ